MAEEVVERKKGCPPKKDTSKVVSDSGDGKLKDNNKNGSNKNDKSKNGNNENENNKNVEIKTEAKKLSPKKQMLQDYYNEIKMFAFETFNIKPTINNNFRCVMCGKEKPHSDFFRSYSIANMGTLMPTGERHLTVCKRCSKKIFDCFLEESGDAKSALNRWCQTLNIYYSDLIYQRTIELREAKKNTQIAKKFDFITDYMTALGTAKMINMTYWDSPYLQNNIESLVTSEEEVPMDVNPKSSYPEEFDDWPQEDLENYDYIIQIYKYDPFKDEPIEDRRKLYYTLSGFSDENISEDTGKANACVDMCRSMQRLEKLNRMRIQLEQEDDLDVKRIKMISELQEKERKSIQAYQKEWGFNQKYALNKQQGAGTLTGIMKQMDLDMFEDALVNRYDIATCEGMQQAAEASWKAIFNQLNISDSEYATVVQNQNERIRKMQKELMDTKEALRLANIQIKRRELEDLAKIQNGGES